MISEHEDPPSPCIGICQINPLTSYCDGCFRNEDEVTDWWDLNPQQKCRILTRLDARRENILAGLWD